MAIFMGLTCNLFVGLLECLMSLFNKGATFLTSWQIYSSTVALLVEKSTNLTIES